VIQAFIDIVSWPLILAGSFFTVVGMLGLVRMPDLFTRMHAASVTDTLGAGLLILGMMLQAGFSLVTLKLVFLLLLFVFTAPVVTHALAQAALNEGIGPQLAEDRRAGRGGGGPPPEPTIDHDVGRQS
jgi:multicomponent Na+:H+ antiporter subunit G